MRSLVQRGSPTRLWEEADENVGEGGSGRLLAAIALLLNTPVEAVAARPRAHGYFGGRFLDRPASRVNTVNLKSTNDRRGVAYESSYRLRCNRSPERANGLSHGLARGSVGSLHKSAVSKSGRFGGNVAMLEVAGGGYMIQLRAHFEGPLLSHYPGQRCPAGPRHARVPAVVHRQAEAHSYLPIRGAPMESPVQEIAPLARLPVSVRSRPSTPRWPACSPTRTGPTPVDGGRVVGQEAVADYWRS